MIEVTIVMVFEREGGRLRSGTRELPGILTMSYTLIWMVVTWGTYIGESTSCSLEIHAF
jgi:hypothetical protein